MAGATAEQDIIGSIQTQLEGLQKTEDGMLLYRLIERGLGKHTGTGSASTDEAFLTFLYTLLERYAKNRDGDPITRIKVRVIQQRLTPHLLHNQDADASGEPEEPVPVPVHADTGTPEPEMMAGVSEAAETDDEPELMAGVGEANAPTEPEVQTEPEPALFDDDIILSPDTTEEEPPAEETTVEIPPPEPEPAKVEAKPSKPKDTPKVETKPAPAKPKAKEAPKAKPKPKAEPKSRPKGKPTLVKDKPPVKAKEPAAPEPPKKKVTLSLVEATDLTQPAPPPEEDDGIDIDLGETVSPKPKAKPQAAQKPAKKQVASQAKKKTASKPAGKPAGQLVPRKPAAAKPAAKPASGDGPSSQERVEKLHETFVHKMAESITRSQEYHSLLRSHMKAIELAENEDDFKDLKSLLVRGMEDLLKGNETLGRDLDATNHYLKIARLDRALLKDELGRVRETSTIDGLTALQNQAAFIRQLQAEISRVNRYGFSFAVAVIDIDNLKAINDVHGRDAGDEVLRVYAREILSQFRSYDLVARSKSDTFLLLFPNTQKEGAVKAVEKAQKKAAGLVMNYKDKTVRLPSFSSVLTVYTPGDKPEVLLRRAHEALAQAKQQGRNQMVMALPSS